MAKPCPCCHDAKPAPESDNAGNTWVRCYGCGMTGPVDDTKDQAVARWDALPRTEETCPPAV